MSLFPFKFNGFKKSNSKGAVYDFYNEFNNVIVFSKSVCEKSLPLEEKIIILDCVLQTLRNDLQYDLLSEILYKSPHDTRVIYPFPDIRVVDDTLNSVEYVTDTIKSINLKKDCVLLMPWEQLRWQRSMINIFNNEFEFQSNNHFAYYYTLMEVTHVYNGNHSVSAGITHKKGFIDAKIIDVEAILPHIYCDSKNVYSVYDEQLFYPLYDFRIGLIFEVAKMKYNLINR